MKNFIKLSFVTLALLLATNANAQLLPISLGVKGGITSSTVSTKGFDSKSGFNAGLTLDVNLPANLAIMTGLEVNTKGAKTKEGGYKMNSTNLQLPVHLGYRIKVIPGFRLHLSAGPYFAQGIGGKTEILGENGKVEKVKTFSGDNALLKKSDWGLGVGAGATVLGMVQVRVGYDWGMVNLAKHGSESVKNRSFYASLGLGF